jgi:hypothetical protein
MSEDEKKMYIKQSEDRQSDEEKIVKPTSSFKKIVCRGYLWAFSVYITMYNFIYYNLYNSVPFYLNKVLKAGESFSSAKLSLKISSLFSNHILIQLKPSDTEVISYIAIGLAFLIAIFTIIFSYVFQRADKVNYYFL